MKPSKTPDNNYEPAVEIEFPFLTPLLNKWQRLHWTEREVWKQRCRDVVLEWYAKEEKPLPEEGAVLLKKPVVIWLTRFSSQQPDWDGLVGCAKPILDALVAHRIIKDDSPAYISRLEPDWTELFQFPGYITCLIDEVEPTG